MKVAQPHEPAAHNASRPASCVQHSCCSSYSGPRSWKVFVGGCGTDTSGCDATLGAVSTDSCGAEDPESAAACGRCLRPPYSACITSEKSLDPDAQDHRGRKFDKSSTLAGGLEDGTRPVIQGRFRQNALEHGGEQVQHIMKSR